MHLFSDVKEKNEHWTLNTLEWLIWITFRVYHFGGYDIVHGMIKRLIWTIWTIFNRSLLNSQSSHLFYSTIRPFTQMKVK